MLSVSQNHLVQCLRDYTMGISKGDSPWAIFRVDYLRGDSGDLAKYGKNLLFFKKKMSE